MTMPENPRVTAAVEHELDKLQRIFSNLKRAADEGRITPHDHDERAMRADQWTANVIAYLRGEPRPEQRMPQPLDNPDAGRVG
jgi:hypothetical protein